MAGAQALRPSVKGEKQASPALAVPWPGCPPSQTPHLLPVEAADGPSRLAEELLSPAEFPFRDQVVPAGHALEKHQALLHQVGHHALLLGRAGSADWQHPGGRAGGRGEALRGQPLRASLPRTRCRGEQRLERGPTVGHSPGHDQLRKLYILWDPGSAYGITDVSMATKRVIGLNLLGPVFTGKNAYLSLSTVEGLLPSAAVRSPHLHQGLPSGQPATSWDFVF